jgi:Tol biopolymer transport system component
MRGSLARLALVSPVLVAAALQAGPAYADPGPIQLISKTATEHADFAETPAISLDGRFVAFRGSIGGRMGIFRKDLATGEIAEVFAGSAYVEPPSASEPSISADGSYVSFTTTASLDPANDDTPGSVPQDRDVYVADMSTDPPSYELASALDESEAGLSYTGTTGSIASGRASLSASGREVVFVTTTGSNLTDPAKADTPELQVVWRDLASKSTRLISSARNTLSGAMEPGVPVAGGAVAVAGNGSVGPGAALSADGSTVAWLGANVAAQVPLLPDETEAIATGKLPYNEPLWRRVPTPADPAPPTRRVVGGGDGPFPGLPNGHPNLESDSCGSQNGWIAGRSRLDFVPELSADGRQVALVGEPNGFANAFVVDMTEGLPRAQAVRQLTREIPILEDNACRVFPTHLATAGDVTGVAVSPSGDRVAITTQRQQFPLAPPNLIGGPPSAMGIAELYLVDLRGQTLQRLTHGTTASEPSKRLEEAEGGTFTAMGAASVSFDGSGEALAFSSRASNLVPGDGNGDITGGGGGSDAFLVTDPRGVSAPPGSAALSTPPPQIRSRPRWRLAARVVPRRDGSARLLVAVPGAGRLRAKAETAIGPPLTVATARRRVRRASVVALSLQPAPRFRRLVYSTAGLEAELEVRFSGPGGRPLEYTLEVRFRSERGRR